MNKYPKIEKERDRTVITYSCHTNNVKSYLSTPISTYNGKIPFKTIIYYPNIHHRQVIFEKYQISYYSTIKNVNYFSHLSYSTIINYSSSIINKNN